MSKENFRGKALSVWLTPSSKGTTKYETVLWENSELTCDCPGWVIARHGVRSCKHTKEKARVAPDILSGKAKKVFEEDTEPIRTVRRSEVLGERKGRMIRRVFDE